MSAHPVEQTEDKVEPPAVEEQPGERDEPIPGKGRAVRVAIDVMGGDNAPGAIIDGAILALKNIEQLELILVGDESVIAGELEKRSFMSASLKVRHAEEAVEMDEAPSVALRKKRRSSIHVGIKLLKAKEADAFVSAGNTGAVMAVAAVTLRTMEGIDRAAIAVTLPSVNGHSVMLDAGANVVCKAVNLYQFGVMGSVYAQDLLGIDTPRVGLLSIGEEDTKGTDMTREALELLGQSPAVNFVGNVEAKLLYKDTADVVVCDGFTGNIALKVSESVAGMITHFLKEVFASGWRGKIGYLFVRPLLSVMKKKIDHTEVGGAPLLGIDGAVFIAHGSSDSKAVANSIKGAHKFVARDVNGHIREGLAKSPGALAVGKMDSEGFLNQIKKKIWGSGEEEETEEK